MPRVMDIATPLGPDVLLFHSMRASETLGRLFDYQLTLLATRNDIDPKALLGKHATVKLQLPKGGPRHFDGCITRFALTGSHGRYVRYEMQLRPWQWFLTRAADCRIFQKQTVPDIIKQIFAKYPNAAFELRLSGSYQPWDYCVQYRETDHNFISRLMEQEGIYSYFTHAEGKHTLILADSPAAHDPYPGYASIGYVLDNRSSSTEKERIVDWAWGAQVQSGKYVIDEYDFTKPGTELQQKSLHPREHDEASHEIYDWPGEYDAASEGDTYVRLRMEEVQAAHERIHALSNARGIGAGHTFKLKGHPRADQNKQYLIVACHLDLASNDYEAASSGGATFNASFEAIPAATQYRSPRDTPKPLIQGVQTAKVVGPAGEEIYTDEYGRVKVHFHWDRYGKQDENDSCWIRVSHPWAGKNFGMMGIPRLGQEVVVDFVDGDPDRPLITGRVYNAEQMHPWDLPANKTQTGILSRSTKGGAYGNANAIRFEDKLGEEQLWLHAEKDQLTEVEHDEDKWVGNDRRKTIDGNETTTVHKNRTETVDQNETITVHQNRTERVDRNESISIGQNRSEDVELNEHIEIGVNRTEFVGANETVTIGKNRSVTIGGSKSETIARAKSETIALAKALTIGGAYQTSVGAAMNTSVGLLQAEQVGLSKTVTVGTTYSLSAGTGPLGGLLGGGGAPGGVDFKDHIVAPEAGSESEEAKPGSNITMDAESITLTVGEAKLVMKKDGTIICNGKTIDLVGTDHIQLDSKRIDLN
ncbi:MAG: type VI secretion system tip protein VgrG [Sterolibacteriaceae bacterium]|nr:type VI secretion system tip protein VgrG [Candidatus Methylophosphatis haderslevensis]